MARTLAALHLRFASRTRSGAGKTGYHGAFPSRPNESANQYHGHRSGGRRAERHRHAGRKRRAFWTRATAPVARSNRTRRAEILLHSAALRSFPRDERQARGAGENEQRFSRGGGGLGDAGSGRSVRDRAERIASLEAGRFAVGCEVKAAGP